MPLTSSAKKALKRSKVLQQRNLDFKIAMKKSIKFLKLAILENNVNQLPELLQNAYKTIDKAAQRNIIHKNNAARKKSRLTSYVNKISA